jgi:Hint-domain
MMSPKSAPVIPPVPVPIPVTPPVPVPIPDPPTCFAGDSLVSMADGTFRPIKDVKQGDIVLTGTGIGQGVVTGKLAYPVEEGSNQDIIVATTALGELVGTGHHPVLVDGEWRDLGAVASMEAIPPSWSHFVFEIVRKHRDVDFWYHLEIDGDVEYKEGDELISSHTYVVNGMVASGLGDQSPSSKLVMFVNQKRESPVKAMA